MRDVATTMLGIPIALPMRFHNINQLQKILIFCDTGKNKREAAIKGIQNIHFSAVLC
jgi:hypothetical protein